MRVYELAKELEVGSKDVLEVLKKLDAPVKGHMSSVDAAVLDKVRAQFGGAGVATKVAEPKTAAKPKPEPVKAAAKPKPQAAAKPMPPKTKPQPAAPSQPPQAPQPKAAPPEPEAEPKPEAKERLPLEIKFPVTVAELAPKLGVKPSELIKRLMGMKVFATMTQTLDEIVVMEAADSFGFEVSHAPTLQEQLEQACEPDTANLVWRAPVVTFMGHVDHGKTSLMDAIRKAEVAEGEHGGITQHIGAYEVTLEKGRVTFLDTPGHEAFSALRARGANVTDVVVLVVAADDGVKPQTVEAINHARAADVPIVVAVNKMDKPDADIQRVMQQLSQYDLLSEDWGGKTIMVPVSAKSGKGIEDLLDMLILESELLELKADPKVPSSGVVIESKHTRDRGSVVSLLIQQGTIRLGDTVVAGSQVGRIRAMFNDHGKRIESAGPSQPIEVLGISGLPNAGDKFLVCEDEKAAKRLAMQREETASQAMGTSRPRMSLEDLHQQIAEGKLKELRLILKGDVQGSLEAIKQSLEKLDTEKDEVQIRILHAGIGDISESDVILATASDAIIIGFHVGIDMQVQVLAAKEGVDIHMYSIIYDLVNAIKASIEGMLSPNIEETFLGRAEVLQLFRVSKIGMVAGCKVVKGTIRKDSTMRVFSGKEKIYEGPIRNLKRVKDDVREVQEGFECGISVEGSAQWQPGDLVESWEIKEVARTLG